MILTLKTEGHFEAAHHLLNYKGECAKVHGHRWRVEVWVRGSSEWLDKSGILIDFKKLKSIWKDLDHEDLNKFFGDETSPSAENICLYLYNLLEENKRIHPYEFRIRVYESPESYCEVGDF